MSDMLFLYKKLTAAGSIDVGEDALKFSVILNKEYADMLNELTKRSGLARAQIARMLICTSLDEIDQAYNLKNDPDFDYDATYYAEERLRELDEFRIQYEIEKEESRMAGLHLIAKAVPETDEDKKTIELARKEIEEYETKRRLQEKIFNQDVKEK